jgi:hypothetical protein
VSASPLRASWCARAQSACRSSTNAIDELQSSAHEGPCHERLASGAFRSAPIDPATRASFVSGRAALAAQPASRRYPSGGTAREQPMPWQRSTPAVGVTILRPQHDAWLSLPMSQRAARGDDARSRRAPQPAVSFTYHTLAPAAAPLPPDAAPRATQQACRLQAPSTASASWLREAQPATHPLRPALLHRPARRLWRRCRAQSLQGRNRMISSTFRRAVALAAPPLSAAQRTCDRCTQ